MGADKISKSRRGRKWKESSFFKKKLEGETYLGGNYVLELSKLLSLTLSTLPDSLSLSLCFSLCIGIYQFNKAFPFH